MLLIGTFRLLFQNLAFKYISKVNCKVEAVSRGVSSSTETTVKFIAKVTGKQLRWISFSIKLLA